MHSFRVRFLLPALAAALLSVAVGRAADLTDSLKKGTPDLKSAGALAFGAAPDVNSGGAGAPAQRGSARRQRRCGCDRSCRTCRSGHRASP